MRPVHTVSMQRVQLVLFSDNTPTCRLKAKFRGNLTAW